MVVKALEAAHANAALWPEVTLAAFVPPLQRQQQNLTSCIWGIMAGLVSYGSSDEEDDREENKMQRLSYHVSRVFPGYTIMVGC